MKKEKIYIFDTTLRDGAQTEGVDFTIEDKNKIAKVLSDIGVDYIEGGWPGANPVDSEFFDKRKEFGKTRLVAFGMTKRFGRSVENDETLAQVISAGTSVVCLVGKSHDFHVQKALGISLDENVELITSSTKYLKSKPFESLLDLLLKLLNMALINSLFSLFCGLFSGVLLSLSSIISDIQSKSSKTIILSLNFIEFDLLF